MPRNSTLADRLAALAITPEELAAIVKRPVEEVGRWVKAETLGGEAAVLLRFLADDADALRRVNQLRRTDTTNLAGDGAAYAGVDPPPYGTNDSGRVTGMSA